MPFFNKPNFTIYPCLSTYVVFAVFVLPIGLLAVINYLFSVRQIPNGILFSGLMLLISTLYCLRRIRVDEKGINYRIFFLPPKKVGWKEILAVNVGLGLPIARGIWMLNIVGEHKHIGIRMGIFGGDDLTRLVKAICRMAPKAKLDGKVVSMANGEMPAFF